MPWSTEFQYGGTIASKCCKSNGRIICSCCISSKCSTSQWRIINTSRIRCKRSLSNSRIKITRCICWKRIGSYGSISVSICIRHESARSYSSISRETPPSPSYHYPVNNNISTYIKLCLWILISNSYGSTIIVEKIISHPISPIVSKSITRKGSRNKKSWRNSRKYTNRRSIRTKSAYHSSKSITTRLTWKYISKIIIVSSTIHFCCIRSTCGINQCRCPWRGKKKEKREKYFYWSHKKTKK